MPGAFCRAPVGFAGYVAVQLFNGAGISATDRAELCSDLRDESGSLRSIADVAVWAEAVAARFGLAANTIVSEPDDPLEPIITVVLVRGPEPMPESRTGPMIGEPALDPDPA